MNVFFIGGVQIGEPHEPVYGLTRTSSRFTFERICHEDTRDG